MYNKSSIHSAIPERTELPSPASPKGKGGRKPSVPPKRNKVLEALHLQLRISVNTKARNIESQMKEDQKKKEEEERKK